MKPVTVFYAKAATEIAEAGYGWEQDYVWKIKSLEQQDPETFLVEYIWVVLNGSGLREQVVRKIFDKFMENRDLNTLKNRKRREAIAKAIACYTKWFAELQKAEDKIAYLDSLPFIGPITKYHLARNIGIDTVKPDRHLVKFASKFGYSSPMEMCLEIQREIGNPPLGVIDVVLWRWANLFGTDHVGQTRLKT